MTDEELMQAYQRGDDKAFETLYRRYSPRVYGFLKKHIVDAAKRDEVFQNVFLKLHRSRRRYDPALPFVPWLFTICRSVLIDSVRSGRVFETVLPTEKIEALSSPRESEAPEPSQRELNRKDLAAMKPMHREVIELRYLDEMSFSAMAKRLDLSEVSVRKRVSRAVKELKGLVGAKRKR